MKIYATEFRIVQIPCHGPGDGEWWPQARYPYWPFWISIGSYLGEDSKEEALKAIERYKRYRLGTRTIHDA